MTEQKVQMNIYLLVPNIEPPFPVQPLTEVQLMGSICSEIKRLKWLETEKHALPLLLPMIHSITAYNYSCNVCTGIILTYAQQKEVWNKEGKCAATWPWASPSKPSWTANMLWPWMRPILTAERTAAFIPAQGAPMFMMATLMLLW